MAIPLDPKQIVLSEVPGSLAGGRDSVACGGGIFIREEFLKMVAAVHLEIKRMV